MSQLHLDSTPLGMNMTNGTTSPTDLIPVGTKPPEPTSLTQPTYFPEENGKAHGPRDLDPDPSSLDPSSNKSNSLEDKNYSKSIKKKSNKKKKCRKHKK